MANRQDRRYAAKLARQSAKVDRSPAGKALLRAAADFAMERPFEIDFELPDMEGAWDRLKAHLEDQLGDDFLDFRRALYDEASSLAMTGTSAAGDEFGFTIQTVLFPVVGPRSELTDFVANEAKLLEMATSLRQSGVVPESSAVAVLPVIVSAFAADLNLCDPGAVHTLTKTLAQTLFAPSGELKMPHTPEALSELVYDWAPSPAPEEPGEGPVSGFLLALAATALDTRDVSDEELETEDLALAAAGQSWADTYAAELPFRLGGLALWSDAGAASAWLGLAHQIEAETARRGLEPDITEIHAYFDNEVENSVFAVRCSGKVLGPFRVSNRLVFADIDSFAAEAEFHGKELIEYERADKLLKLIATEG